MWPCESPLAVVKISEGGGAGREERCCLRGDSEGGREREPEGRGREDEDGRAEREERSPRSVEGRAERERGACLLGSV